MFAQVVCKIRSDTEVPADPYYSSVCSTAEKCERECAIFSAETNPATSSCTCVPPTYVQSNYRSPLMSLLYIAKIYFQNLSAKFACISYDGGVAMQLRCGRISNNCRFFLQAELGMFNVFNQTDAPQNGVLKGQER